jgi:arsenite methyltransferase
MMAHPPHLEPPDYGIDAPAVLRNLFIVGMIGVLAWSVVSLMMRSGREIPLPVLSLADMAFGTGLLCIVMAFWILWESKIGKMRTRDRLLARITWTGHERVLDVGCGRGLLLIGAARCLKTGKAIGIDIWQAEDLTGNNANATLENARREGVVDRVEVQTADMRQMPFTDSSFDIVLSRAAIHNIYTAEGRAAAIREIARVLKPGGQAVIEDIRHLRQYIRIFSQNGCTDIRRGGSLFAYTFFTIVTFGSLRPSTLLVRKSA